MTATRTPRLAVHTERLPTSQPLVELLPDPHGLAWLHGDDGFVAWGQAMRIDPGTGAGRFQRAMAGLEAVFSQASVAGDAPEELRRPLAVASFTFDPEEPGSVVIVPAVMLRRRGGDTYLTRLGDGDQARGEPPPLRVHDRVRYAGSTLPDLRWLDAVAHAIAAIEAGRLRKVVLARDRFVWAKAPFDPRLLLRRLAQRFPGCYTFACAGLVGATPELLIERRGPRVASLALAGSAPRGADPAGDTRLGEGLLASTKERDEHAFAVDSVRAALGPLCSELQAPPAPSLVRLANVQHLGTRITGVLADAVTALALAGVLHPTAAVGGAPTGEALTAIRELEGMGRGRYAGPVGWMDAAGDGEFGIALRCAQVEGARARMFAGAGIVAGSLPEDELEETRVKLLAMQSAFDG